MKPSPLLNGLNNEQIAAVTHKDGPLLIIAGAGTGKTTVITRRLAWLIEQGLVKPNEILALTFTEKAAGEMEERVDRLLPYGYLDLWISTFHSFCQRILESHALEIGLPTNFKLLTPTEIWVLIRKNLERFNLDYYRPLGNPSRFIHALINHFSRAKDELISPEDYLEYAKNLELDSDNDLKIKKTEDGSEPAKITEVAGAYVTYQKLLVDNNALDFGDLITYTYRLLTKRPAVLTKYRKQFKYILVDEFQDTNYTQFELLKLLAGQDGNITVVGDDDQSIYKFRGASVSNILKFKEVYPQSRQVTLVQNYRSFQNLLNLSYKFIQLNNPDRLEVKLKISKKLKAQRKGDGLIELAEYRDYHQEAQSVLNKILELKNASAEASWNDFAVLVRANETAEVFTETFDRAQLPYLHLSRRGLYRKPIITELLDYFRLLDNYHESSAMYRVLNLKKFQITAVDLSKILDYSRKKSYSLYESIKHPDLVKNLEEKTKERISDLLALIEKHTALARTKPVNEIFPVIVKDLKLISFPQDSLNGSEAQEINLIDQFYRRIKDFAVGNDKKQLRDFLDMLEMEFDAGEQGQLDFDTDVGPEAVKIITVHSAKGLEFRYVFLPALIDKKFPAIAKSEPIELPEKLIKDILPTGNAHIQEERRLFYVAMTRARDGLFFSFAKDYGGASIRRPSIFLRDLGLQTTQGQIEPTGQVFFKEQKKQISKLSLPNSFSFTSISTFRSCSLEYKYTHLLKIPQPGSGAQSFGQTIHKTLEDFLRIYQQQSQSSQGDLFLKKTEEKPAKLPPEKRLLQLYAENWIDDWFDGKAEKERYRKHGITMLKTLYKKFESSLPTPKYLEKPFKLGLKDYLLTGKIDRADETPNGLIIIDYKTGADRPLDKVDREQLLIYQWAAKDFLREQVIELQYWYLKNGLVIKNFLGSEEQLEEVRLGLLQTIEMIVDAVKTDNFEKYHKKHQNCKFL